MGRRSDDLMSIASTITSKHIERIVIGLNELISNAQLESAIKSNIWGEFDDAIARLAEQTANHGRKLQLELHVRGNPSVELFDRIFVRFTESGDLKIVKTPYIWAGSLLRRPSFSKKNT